MTGPSTLGQRSWPDLDGKTITLVVPLGSVEQHGPHLPLDADTRIAAAVADGVCDGTSGEDVLRAPDLNYGASGEHEGFPGTISIGHDALKAMLVEYGRSACRWARRILFVNGHGGNTRTLIEAVSLLRYEGRDAAWFPCAFPDADAHAGFTETSVLLHVSPESVALERAVAGNREPVGALLGAMRESGVAAVSPNGVLGDPAGATADEGRRLLDDVTGQLRSALSSWEVDGRGRLT
ncbi:mycofactocin biosynthesis peptidyl-dipeptidase MftE [Gordonia paraffinivorans]|uniref:Creatininase family protein n=1 Tax=Gordonia paraffinivorans NBRC 108238 TaxID=1223543 RepID=A0ABQ0IHN3_9ACTN|nr:mycofactocin biosynthesis peptidyl-dipeptidase MftE [Gordonia paraffinivorans]MBY4572452.1 mycofactocin biosynthesis peptidyl-dipeptidase MftE [Gordonia paraffinivorans]PWD44205.1 mycofactocin biosynthesis peptidyl-dipeptidase MftE [Gordonia paraffinivorans]GAC83113.1 creatininase family protein [Gordonia paraffinivorans NBRC 108238]